MHLHTFLNLITSLLKSWELGLYFKNTKKKEFYFLLVFEIMNLYVRHILILNENIVCFIFILTLEWLDF